MSDGKTRRRMNEREWQCFEDGVNWERERIIKLLEDMVGKLDGNYENPKEVYGALLDAIALIKGEPLEDEQTMALKAEIAELQNDLDRFGPDMDICTCELIEAEIERLTNQLNGEK